MIRIIDSTLAMVDAYAPNKAQIHAFCEGLKALGITDLEISTKVYKEMGDLPEGIKFYLLVPSHLDIKEYPGIYKYIAPRSADEGLIGQFQLNDIRELVNLKGYDHSAYVRIIGLDDLICHNYNYVMKEIKTQLKGCKINLCPENTYHCATAIAVEWILQGGNEVTTSFTGVGGRAATEEVMMALRINSRYKVNQTFQALHDLKELMECITKEHIEDNKPIIGDRIFHVESGIHVDGILKKQSNYEAYTPEEVGQTREVVLGKHSGSTSIVMKLEACGYEAATPEIIRELLRRVKHLSMQQRRSIFNTEFIDIVNEVMGSERSEKNS